MPNENKENFNVDGDYQNPPELPISKGQKIAAIFLAVFGLMVIIFWAIDFKKSISGPAYVDNSADIGQTASTADDAQSEASLKAKDTDQDGLNDWDELNVYRTSPYLDDSDSDGILDGAEVSAGKDPNCPEGRTCYAVDKTDETDVNNAGSSTTPNVKANNIAPTTTQTASGSVPSLQAGNVDQASVQNLLNGKMDVATLRKFLIDSGMDKAMLDKINDQDLMKSYGDVLKPAN